MQYLHRRLQRSVIGITRFKITGGEPLVRKGCADLIRMIRQIPGTEEVTMTTNGVLLGENLEDLLAAGLDAVNISLDTLIPEKYQEITGADELERVRKSIFMAEKSGIRVKINTVLQKGVNKTDIQLVLFRQLCQTFPFLIIDSFLQRGWMR